MGTLAQTTPTWCVLLTAVTTFLAGFPRFECCRWIDRPQTPAQNAPAKVCCCGGQNGEPGSDHGCPCCRQNAPAEPVKPAKGQPEEPSGPAQTPVDGLQVGHAGCTRILIRPDSYISSTGSAEEGAALPAVASTLPVVVSPLPDFTAAYRPDRATPLVRPPADRLALLQLLLI
jgi:hypothetical protein